MSFQYTKYESDAGGIYRIRVSDATLAVTGNAPPAGAITDGHVDVSVAKHGQKRKGGIHARGVILQRFTGTGAARKRYTTFLPILDAASLVAFPVDADVTVNGVAYTVSSDVAEV